MVSSSVIKLIDEAIAPAALLILAKLLGFFLVSYFGNVPITINFKDILGILPSIQFISVSDYIIAENYSNITMFMAVALGTLLVLSRAHFLHESHINPNVHTKIASLNLEKLIAPSYHLYHQAAIWLTFLWLTTVFLGTSTVFLKITHPAVSAVAFIVAVSFTWVLIHDIEKEIKINGETPQ